MHIIFLVTENWLLALYCTTLVSSTCLLPTTLLALLVLPPLKDASITESVVL